MSGRNKTNIWLQLHNALNANLYDRAEQIVEQIVQYFLIRENLQDQSTHKSKKP